jgi:hypothetical protein
MLVFMLLFGSARMRIELKCWTRIQVNQDPQPCARQLLSKSNVKLNVQYNFYTNF